MSASAKSIFYFGIYLALIGFLLIFAPNLLLPLLGVAETREIWIRLAGMLLVFLGFFYTQSARAGFTPFFRWTLLTRFLAFFFVLAFVVWGGAPWVMLVFWLGDLAGALWTLWALRQERLTFHVER